MKKISITICLFFSFGINICSAGDFTGWKQTETEHFIIIFEEKDIVAAEEIFSFCEEVYDEVTELLGSSPKKVKCVINGRTDIANGFFCPVPAYINLYVSSPSTPSLGCRTENWLKLLLVHEFTHYVHLTYEKGLLAGASRVFGPAVKASIGGFLPGWIIEGITTNTETIFTNGGRGRNPFFELKYRAPVLEDSFFSLDQASYGSSFPPAGRIYVGGYLLVNHLLETYGQNTFTDIHKQYVKFPFFGPWLAIKKTTGRSASNIFDDLMVSLMFKYSDYRKIKNGRLITPDRYADYFLPVITEKGWILYRKNLDSYPAIVIFNPQTGKESVLLKTRLTDYSSLTASARGNIVIFATLDINAVHPAGTVETSDLYLLDINNGNVKKITKNAHLLQPDLSRNGKNLIAVQLSGSYSRLVDVNMKTGEVSVLFEEKETNVYNPVISPDGKNICFTFNIRGMQDIRIINYAGKKAAAAVTGPDFTGDYFPEFIDNENIIFSSDRNGSLCLYSCTTSGENLKMICEDPVGAYAGIIKNNKVIYASYSSKGYCLKEKEISGFLPLPEETVKKDTSPKPFNKEKIECKDYIDFPSPVIWFPVPLYINPFSPESITAGAGIFSMGMSITGKGFWYGLLTFPFNSIHPGGEIYSLNKIWNLNLIYNLNSGYTKHTDLSYSQIIKQTLEIDVPLISHRVFDTKNYMSVYTGITHFFTSFNPDLLNSQNSLSLFTGISFLNSRFGGAKDFYSPFNISGSLGARFPLPVFPETQTGVTFMGVSSLSVPSPVSHQVCKFSIKAGYTNLGKTLTIYPRGFFPPVQSAEGKFLGAFDYLFTIALMDIPLLKIFNLQGFGGALHLETIADWETLSPAFIFRHDIYAGIEITTLLGYLNAFIPICTGISLRFDTSGERSFDIIEDTGFYISFGFNSFENSVFSIRKKTLF